MTAWVEQGGAPDSGLTYRMDASDNVTASRPVYPYPAAAQYTGGGDWRSSANYTKGAPLYNARTRAWLGSIFHVPYVPKQQGVPTPLVSELMVPRYL
jgi:hypothetical protein